MQSKVTSKEPDASGTKHEWEISVNQFKTPRCKHCFVIRRLSLKNKPCKARMEKP